MSDISQGEQQELFQEAIEADTLEKFENPELPKETPKQDDKAPPGDTQLPDAPVPSGRFREEAEARRRAEREVSDLRARIAAYEVNQNFNRQQQQPQKPIDIFDNPAAFVQQQFAPYLQEMETRNQQKLENLSADWAVRNYGEDKVTAARTSLEQGMARQDPNAWATYQRAMSSHDPYGVITRWHLDRGTLQEIGGDLNAYRQRILEEAVKDPEFQRAVLQAARGQAVGSVNRPAITQQPVVSYPPSVSDIGTAGPDEAMVEPSDNALFRAAVSAKRR